MDLQSFVTKAASAHCLVIDHHQVRISTQQPDMEQLGSCLKSTITDAERKKVILKWLPALEEDGLGCVFVQHNRVHLHFTDNAHLARALKAVPFLVRCGATSQSDQNCYGVPRYKLPEALHLVCREPKDVLSSTENFAAVKAFLSTMGIDAQCIWQSNGAVYDAKTNPRLAFWVLPREIDPAALAALIEQVHRKHSLFGTLVDVQGMNTQQLSRCSECHALGHSSATCPQYGGVAVRLAFSKPMSPVVFGQFIQ